MIIPTVRLVKGENPVVCAPERAQYYLDKGYRIAAEGFENDLPEVAEVSRETAIATAVKHIMANARIVELTSAGLPRLEVIAVESGFENVTMQDRSLAMEAIKEKV